MNMSMHLEKATVAVWLADEAKCQMALHFLFQVAFEERSAVTVCGIQGWLIYLINVGW